MTNGPDITARQYAYRAIRAAVPARIAVETKPRTNGAVPYVFVGPSDLVEHPVNFDIRLGVDVWSNKEGDIECKQVQHAVRQALDGLTHVDTTESATPNNPWRLTLVYEELCRCVFEPSNAVWHGTQRFRVLAEDMGP